MKKNQLYALCIGIMALTAFTGCKEEYTPIKSRLYINEAAVTNYKKLTVSVDEETKSSFTVRVGDVVAQDLHATLAIDEEILAAYNEKNKTSYEVLPSEYYTLEKDVLIKSGKTEADPITITITPYKAAEGVKYAIPIRVVGDGSVPEEITASQYLLLLDKPWVQSTPYLKAGTKTNGLSFQGNPIDSDWGVSMSNFSVEFWLWMDGFTVNNQSIIDCSMFYIRMGNTNIPLNTMQINIYAADGTNNKCYCTDYKFQKSTWTHVAIVYDATNSKCIFYMNGTKISESSATGGAPAKLNKFAFAATNNGYSRNNRMMGQLRLWDKVLTQAEIQANMAGPITVSPEMVGYWKMDEGEGEILHDCTGNGHDAKAVIVGNAKVEWRADQCFVK